MTFICGITYITKYFMYFMLYTMCISVASMYSETE